jgi:hypothetical protein
MPEIIRIALVTAFLLVLALALSPAIVLADDISHGHDCVTASQINSNGNTRAVLFDRTDFAVYRMVLDQRGLIDVWTDPGDFSVWDVDLLDSSCRLIPNVHGGKSVMTGQYSKITVPSLNIQPIDNVWTLPAGVYFLRLHPDPVLKGGEPFIFHTKFVAHYGQDCATAEPLPASGSIDGALLYQGDREVFRVKINPPARIHAWTTGPLGRWNQPDINLRFSDCSGATEMELNNDTPTGMLTVPLEVGTYYLSVEPFKRDFLGPFTLHFEFVNGIRTGSWE